MAGDRVQFAIDVAAEMSGGEHTIAQLDEIASQFTRGGSDARTFDEALVRLSDELRAAGESAASLDSQVAAASKSVANAEGKLDSLTSSARTAAAANDGVVPDKLAADVSRATAALTKERAALTALQADAKQAAAAQNRLAKAHRNVTKVAQRHKDRLGDLTRDLSTFRGALGDIGGPLGRLGEQALFPVQAFADLNEYMGLGAATATVAIVGYAALAAAVAAVGVAAAAAVAGITAMGVALANNARNARLNLEALEALDPAFRGLGGTIRDVQAVTPLSSAELVRLSRSLRDAGVSAEELPMALKAVASAEGSIAGAGDEVIQKMKEAKGSIASLANEAQNKFGGIVSRKMLALDVQAATLQRHLGDLFSGLKIESLLGEVARLVALFDETSATGKTLKFLFESLFQPVIDGAKEAGVVVEAFFLGMAIGALRVYIALKPVVDRVEELLDFEVGGWELEDVLDAAAKAGEYLVPILLGVTVGVAALGAAIMVAGALILAWAAAPIVVLAALGYAIYSVVSDWISGAALLVTVIAGLVEKVIGKLAGFYGQVVSLGVNIMTGLASGIYAGAGAVVAAVTGAVGGAIGAAKRQLGIASPSKVFAEIGLNTSEGMAQGVDRGADRVEGSMSDMAAPPDLSDSAVSGALRGASSGSSAGGPSFDFSGASIVFQGIAGAPHAVEEFSDMLTRALRGDAIAVGGAT